jgi:hypothetical protein
MGVQNLQKHLRVVRPSVAPDLPSLPGSAQAGDAAAPVRGPREIGDLRLPADVALSIKAVLPAGMTLEKDVVTVRFRPVVDSGQADSRRNAISIQFDRISGASRPVALLYVDEAYEELMYPCWFLASVCLRMLVKLRFASPSIEIFAPRSDLVPASWMDELQGCLDARIAKSVACRGLNVWSGPEIWIADFQMSRDDSQNAGQDTFGEIAKPTPGANRANVNSIEEVDKARRRAAPLVFISYSHHPDDKPLFDKLKTVLNTFNDNPKYRTNERRKVVWTDEDIKTSDYWKDSIEEAINSARVAVALVTPRFFDSEFIKNEELKPILERVNKKEKKVAWVPGAVCAYEEYGLSELQAACSPNQPLNLLDAGSLDRLLNEVRKKVKGLIDEILANEPD